ncbi:MAG: hypothetical protein ACLP3K_06745 [Candidatus Acidiferrales bacterium]
MIARPPVHPSRADRALRARALVAFLGAVLLTIGFAPLARAQETPYFVAYSHHLEEPGNLEIETYSIYGTQQGHGDFIAPWMELEYGVTAWWTTEFYIDSQTTFGDSTVFTGTRWENRFRPLMHEHWINPVLYVEFENTTDADKTLKEVVGFDDQLDAAEPNSMANQSHAHEIETKLILSSDYKGWNFSENFISEKNLGHEPWEFGYALGISRPLRLAATPRPCNFCRENFILGAEAYGGLGTTDLLTLSGTSHYVAPIVAWQMPSGVTLSVSPGFGLTDVSHRFLLRWGMSYEIGGFGRKLRSLF